MTTLTVPAAAASRRPVPWTNLVLAVLLGAATIWLVRRRAA
jgi:hypothetical protein